MQDLPEWSLKFWPYHCLKRWSLNKQWVTYSCFYAFSAYPTVARIFGLPPPTNLWEYIFNFNIRHLTLKRLLLCLKFPAGFTYPAFSDAGTRSVGSKCLCLYCAQHYVLQRYAAFWRRLPGTRDVKNTSLLGVEAPKHREQAWHKVRGQKHSDKYILYIIY